MIKQTLNTITFELKETCDFSFISKYGEVFSVFDENDSGNISFCTRKGNEKYFIKIAGCKTKESDITPLKAVEILKKAMKNYEELKHPNLIQLIDCFEFGRLYVAVFKWYEGECLFDHWNFDKYAKNPNLKSPFTKFKELSIEQRLKSLNIIFDFLKLVESKNFVAVDFYDGSIMYDFIENQTIICDIDLFMKKPYENNIGEDYWGTKRFKAPEEYKLGQKIDSRTNVFTMGALLFHFFGNYTKQEIKSMYLDKKFIPCIKEKWELGEDLYNIVAKAVEYNKEKRYKTMGEFCFIWEEVLKRELGMKM